jgi:hypothetical protein
VVEFSKPTRERATDHARPENTDPHLSLLSPVTPAATIASVCRGAASG